MSVKKLAAPRMSLAAPRMSKVWRVVETQEVAATRAITRSAAEQSRLEELLDASKPSQPGDCAGLSYLLMTPFRYPPLDYGSRFGTAFERGIFYASENKVTAFAEAAVYLWLFQSGLRTLGPLSEITDQRTLFSARLKSTKSVDLRGGEFSRQIDKIMLKNSWQHSQALGSELRSAGVEYLLYPSCRLDGGTNAAVFSPLAFQAKKPIEEEHWLMRLQTDVCWFGHHAHQCFEFRREDFECDGVIPHAVL